MHAEVSIGWAMRAGGREGAAGRGSRRPVPDHELDELRRADQAADVRGSYPVVAALHLAP